MRNLLVATNCNEAYAVLANLLYASICAFIIGVCYHESVIGSFFAYPYGKTGMSTDPLANSVAERIAQAFHPDKIILFGSRARGVARQDSDLDIAVIYSGAKEKRELKLAIHKMFEPASISMDLFVLTPEEFERQKHVANTLARELNDHGVALYG